MHSLQLRIDPSFVIRFLTFNLSFVSPISRLYSKIWFSNIENPWNIFQVPLERNWYRVARFNRVKQFGNLQVFLGSVEIKVRIVLNS